LTLAEFPSLRQGLYPPGVQLAQEWSGDEMSDKVSAYEGLKRCFSATADHSGDAPGFAGLPEHGVAHCSSGCEGEIWLSAMTPKLRTNLRISSGSTKSAR